MKKLIVTVLCLLLMAIGGIDGPLPAEEGNIVLKAVAEIEIEEFNEEGMKVLKRVPAAKVVPGDEVIYSILYTHVGKAPAEKVMITNPIPEHMRYKEGSASGENTRITFSVDSGKTYDIPENLKIVGADGKERPAKPSEYTHIRWILQKALPPATEGQVSFRAILE